MCTAATHALNLEAVTIVSEHFIIAVVIYNQLESIEEVSNVKHNVFPNEIYLKEKNFPQTKIRIEDTTDKYNFETTTKVTLNNNIAYTNKTYNQVSKPGKNCAR